FIDGISVFKNNLVQAMAAPYKVDPAAGAILTAEQLKTKAEADGTITYENADDIMLEAPFNFDTPNYLPKSGSPALTGAKFEGLDDFFTEVTYRGALGTSDWLAQWTSFTPQTNIY